MIEDLPSLSPRKGSFDERVHTEKGTLEHLFRNVLQYLELDLAPRLRELPSQSLLIMFSYHGFIENPHFEKADKYRTPRYTHGEDSPFEVIVPLGHGYKDIEPALSPLLGGVERVVGTQLETGRN